ncbi:hypothetical protein LINPERHAP1_LOCUS1751 [Linum perenne]
MLMERYVFLIGFLVFVMSVILKLHLLRRQLNQCLLNMD